MKTGNQMLVIFCMIVSLVFVVSCEKKKLVTDAGNAAKTDNAALAKDAGGKDKSADNASKPTEEVVSKKDEGTKFDAGENKDGVKESMAVKSDSANDVYFDYDSSTIQDSQMAAIKKEADWMKANSKKTITIEGHCDERGTEEYNIALGDRRAAAAKLSLEHLGISGKRMNTVSFGKEKPFDNGHNEEAWAKNRRAHFVNKI